MLLSFISVAFALPGSQMPSYEVSTELIVDESSSNSFIKYYFKSHGSFTFFDGEFVLARIIHVDAILTLIKRTQQLIQGDLHPHLFQGMGYTYPHLFSRDLFLS